MRARDIDLPSNCATSVDLRKSRRKDSAIAEKRLRHSGAVEAIVQNWQESGFSRGFAVPLEDASP
jgi:hypothetical protein